MYYKLEGDRQLWSLRDWNSRGAVKQRISLQYYDSMTSIGEAVNYGSDRRDLTAN